jgi:hypothetical protein
VSGSTTWRDLSGNGINGTLTNGPTFSSVNNGGIVFDGVNDSTIFPHNSSLDVGNTISVFSWFYVNSTSSFQPVIAKSLFVSGSSTGWELTNSTGGLLRCTLRPSVAGSNNINVGTLRVDNWYYGGFTCDNTTIRLYLNGVVTGTTAASSLILNNTGSLYVGQRNDGGGNVNFFNGNISTSQIYNRALSASEVLQNYNAQKSRFNL